MAQEGKVHIPPLVPESCRAVVVQRPTKLVGVIGVGRRAEGCNSFIKWRDGRIANPATLISGVGEGLSRALTI